MVRWKTLRIRTASVAMLLGVALVVAACGSSNSTSATSASATAAAAQPTSSATSAAAASGTKVGTAKGAHGTYLTGAAGRPLYLWVVDVNGKSSCSGACAKAWPPLLTTGAPVAGAGVSSAKLGTATRSDGTKQVTYNGHPLYYFVADPTANSFKGQGSDSFGAKWWLVAPSGAAITTAG
jgi:predicted lipoprotein with Yx(FWY)xxD motif